MTAMVPRCFVIGPIGEAGSVVRRKADWVLNGLIKPVLEDVAFGFAVKRADQDPNPGSISDAMINDIYEADLVVADLTGFNPNAFYELGIRHAFQKPAIHIIAERGMKPPFDNQDQRTIEVDFDDYHHVEEAKRALTAAVTYVRGSDFKVSNPVTRARGFAKLIASGDPKDVLLAKLQGELGAMSARLGRLENPSRPSERSEKFIISRNGRAFDRFAEYYNYIRGAVERELQVPFAQEVVDAAVNMRHKSQFSDWYASYNSRNKGWAWLTKLSDLDGEGFDYLEKNEQLASLLNPSQLAQIRAEKERRAASEDGTGE